MAINLTEDINHSGAGKIVSVEQSAGSWQSLATKSDFDNFTSNTTTKQNLTNGQFFYVLDESQLYKLTVAGFGPFATYTLSSASFGDGSTPDGTISGSQQITDLGFVSSSVDTSLFVLVSQTGSFLTAEDTSSFITSDDTGSFLTALDTGSFLTSEDTSSFVLVSETSSMSVATASFIDPTFISASAAASGFGSGGSIPSGTISSSQQITDFGFISSSIDTSSFVLVSETGSFLTAEDTSSFVLVSDTSSMSVATASYVDPTFISASAAASGFGSGGGSGVGGIFIQTGSFYATTNDLQVTGSMTISNGSLILNEYNSLPGVDRGGIIFSNGAFYIGVD